MVRDGLRKSGVSVNDIAEETHYSKDAFHKVFEGKRRIPQDAKRALASLNVLTGLAVALQDTQWVCFEPVQGDHHFLAMIERMHQEMHKLEDEIAILPQHLLDKLKADDLTQDDRQLLTATDRQMIRLLQAIFSFLVESQDQFQEPVTAMLAEKKRAAV
jgi:transcriptional regulator GlxA family with amidase domain